MNPYTELIKAQRRQRFASEDYEYELDENEGYTCTDCNYSELFLAMDVKQDSELYKPDDLLVCPNCEQKRTKNGSKKVLEQLQKFGYPFEDLPQNIESQSK